MKLSDLCIQRPILTSMMSCALVLFGAISYFRLEVREYPDVDPPIVSVTTEFAGAAPQVIESTITSILEEELSTIESLRTLTSTSAEGRSSITLEFDLARDVDAAAQDVRAKVARVRARLPEGVIEPTVVKQDADAQPFVWIALAGKNYDLLDLSQIADRLVKERLQRVPGVAQARVYGERRLSMRIWLSASQLAAHGLTVQDVQQAIRSRNVEIPAGRIESLQREFPVRLLGELKKPEEFAELTVARYGGQLIKLKDLGRVELGPEDHRNTVRYSGAPAVAIGVTRNSKSNMVEVADALRAELPKIQEALASDVKLDIAFDYSMFVRRSIHEAQETLLIAVVLVIGIIFIFLRNFRATAVVGLAIPTSIVATFALLYLLGFSINNFTLLAITLAIGIVVDDAILVLENAFRHQEQLGTNAEIAARDGTREIGFAVIATTIALISVFAPLAFLDGATSRLLAEFGIAVIGAVAFSGFVALTLTPMLCAKMLRVPKNPGRLHRALEEGFNAVSAGYARVLRAALDHKYVIVLGAVLSLAAAAMLFTTLEREFVPPADRGYFETIVIAPEGASLAYTARYQQQAEEILAETEGVRDYLTLGNLFGIGVSRAFIPAYLEDWTTRTRSVQEIIPEVQQKFANVSGASIAAYNPSAFGSGLPLVYVVMHEDFGQLQEGVSALLQRARQVKGLTNPDTDLRLDKPELAVSFDRDRAEDLGVSIAEAAGTFQTLLGGARTGTFRKDSAQHYVMVQLDPRERASPRDLSGIYLRGGESQLINLDAVASVAEGTGPREIKHFNGLPAARITSGLVPGFTVGEAVDELNRIAREVLPPGSSTALLGEARDAQESGSALYFAFGLALLVVFMVLAAQFESLVHPFTVLLAVPLAVTGALLALSIAGSTLNIYSQIGMILLIGLATKNSILLVEYANQLKQRGLKTIDAVFTASRIRLRPILMTSAATVISAVPIALGLGAGSISRRPLGYAIVGGVLFSTLLTLFLIPVVYSLMDRRRAKEI